MATISNPQCCLTWPLFISWNVPKDATRRFSSSVNQQHCSFDGFEPGQQDWFCVSFILRNNLLLQSGFKYPVAQSHSPLLVRQYPLPLQFMGHSLTENKSQIFTKVPTRAFNLYQCKVFFANEFLFSIKCTFYNMLMQFTIHCHPNLMARIYNMEIKKVYVIM